VASSREARGGESHSIGELASLLISYGMSPGRKGAKSFALDTSVVLTASRSRLLGASRVVWDWVAYRLLVRLLRPALLDRVSAADLILGATQRLVDHRAVVGRLMALHGALFDTDPPVPPHERAAASLPRSNGQGFLSPPNTFSVTLLRQRSAGRR
jgi:hypothetical protein